MDANTNQTRTKKIKPTWFRLLLLLVLLGLIFGIYKTFYSGDMLGVVKEQLNKVKEHRITQAYYEYTSKDFQQANSLQTFRQFIMAYAPLANNKTFIYESQSMDNSSGKIEGIVVSKEFEEMRIQYLLAKEGNNWKIENIKLEEIAPEQKKLSEEQVKINEKNALNKKIVNKVHDHLKTIQNNDISEAYYGFLSKEFQQQTSFQEFEKYIKSNPIFILFKNVQIKNSNTEEDKGYVDVILSSDAGPFELSYRLKQEKGEWKIWSMHLILPKEEAEKKIATDPKALEESTRQFLDFIFSGALKKAYKSTAPEFQEVSSFSSFAAFVKEYPALQQSDLIDFKPGIIENGVGKQQINLHDQEGETVLEFKLGFEEGEWKIWGMKVVKTASAKAPLALLEDTPEEQVKELEKPLIEPLEIKAIIIGDAVDAEGLIKIPRDVIDSEINLLFFNVQLENGVSGDLVTLFLNHVDSGTSAPPLSTTLKKDGKTTVAFSYAAPTGGWPVGDYLVKITVGSGKEKIQPFQIRKGEKEFY